MVSPLPWGTVSVLSFAPHPMCHYFQFTSAHVTAMVTSAQVCLGQSWGAPVVPVPVINSYPFPCKAFQFGWEIVYATAFMEHPLCARHRAEPWGDGERWALPCLQRCLGLLGQLF